MYNCIPKTHSAISLIQVYFIKTNFPYTQKHWLIIFLKKQTFLPFNGNSILINRFDVNVSSQANL